MTYLINGGFILLGAVIAFLASAFAARKTSQATIASTRLTLEGGLAYRLWNRRADAYIQAVGYISHRVELAATTNRGFFFNEETEKAIGEFLTSYQRPEWFQLDAQLQALASHTVYRAFTEANAAVAEVHKKASDWHSITERNRELAAAGPGAKAATDAWNVIGVALDAARTARQGLADAIRTELADYASFVREGEKLPTAVEPDASKQRPVP